jgi:hypothetical protein
MNTARGDRDGQGDLHRADPLANLIANGHAQRDGTFRNYEKHGCVVSLRLDLLVLGCRNRVLGADLHAVQQLAILGVGRQAKPHVGGVLSTLCRWHLELPPDDGEVDVVVLNLHSVTSTQMNLIQSSAIRRLGAQTSRICLQERLDGLDFVRRGHRRAAHRGHLGFKEQLRGVGRAVQHAHIQQRADAREPGASRRQRDNFCDRTIGSRDPSALL